MGALIACLEAGLRIPEDIAIVGCGNSHYDEFLRVPLTSVDQKSDAIGQRAGEMVLELIDAEGPAEAQTVFLAPELIVRRSSQRRLRMA
jgi:LacI family transcriptional regulator